MTFTPDIYAEIRDGAQRSARVIAPLLHGLFHPASVVDVGCGEGWFAREFLRLGCDVLGLDESVSGLGIETIEGQHVMWMRRFDLASAPALRELTRRDLAVCLEVAEHLEPGLAKPLVDALCHLAPVVAFSAAVPGQGGHGHLNEQWPDYWADLFRARGYAVSGGLRWHLWGTGVEPWYAQNLLVAADLDAPDHAAVSGNELRGLDLFDGEAANDPLPLVHPVTFTHYVALLRDAERRLDEHGLL